MEAVQQLVTPEMVDKYIESHKDELERYQRAIAALDAIAKEKNLVASEEEIEAEYNQVAREFEVQSRISFDKFVLHYVLEVEKKVCKSIFPEQEGGLHASDLSYLLHAGKVLLSFVAYVIVFNYPKTTVPPSAKCKN